MLSDQERQEANAIRYDVRRLRKLVASSEEVQNLADVERLILPLLPITTAQLEVESSALDMVADILARRDIRIEDSRAVISAFLEQRSLMEELHDRITET